MKYDTPALVFDIVKKWNRARASVMTLRHGPVLTPVFMPVGTKGASRLLFFTARNDQGSYTRSNGRRIDGLPSRIDRLVLIVCRSSSETPIT